MSNNTETHSEVHSWPHIPKIQWEQVWWPITNTSITTFLFLLLVIIFSVFAWKALKSKNSKIKSILVNIIWFLDNFITSSFWDKVFARKFFPLVIWIMFIIFFWNLLWLIIDWIGSISPVILEYVRPIHSDLNTTLVLAIVTVVTFLWISVKTHWTWHTTKWYLFNFTWSSAVEKSINVFVWWLHLIWILATTASLSLRLFWNIFAWIVLIWVITFLWANFTGAIHLWETWRFLSIPFWFFELFVAFIQSAVFGALMIAYFSQSREHH